MHTHGYNLSDILESQTEKFISVMQAHLYRLKFLSICAGYLCDAIPKLPDQRTLAIIPYLALYNILP